MTTKEFFTVSSLEQTLNVLRDFPRTATETVPLNRAFGRILAEETVSDTNLPEFMRSTMDGYAVQARSTFGASEGSPALFTVTGEIEMGKPAQMTVKPGEAVKMPTGGMLPDGADSVVMVEHTESIDDQTLEVYKSTAPLQHVIEIGEDIRKGDPALHTGQRIRPQDMGILAALGKSKPLVFKRPVVAIISTGDEIIDIDKDPLFGQLRDINGYTLSGLVRQAGGSPVYMGIVKDSLDDLLSISKKALNLADIVLVSGGSSVGTRDLTVEAINTLPGSEILIHGISISPGKPTIVARIGEKAFFGLPGHAASAMIVFIKTVKRLIEQMSGTSKTDRRENQKVRAILSRNIASVQGRSDFVRVRLVREKNCITAYPVLGKSGLIRTMVQADGLIEIDINSEGLDKGTVVEVELFQEPEEAVRE